MQDRDRPRRFLKPGQEERRNGGKRRNEDASLDELERVPDRIETGDWRASLKPLKDQKRYQEGDAAIGGDAVRRINRAVT